MARTRGPLMSTSASGTLGHTIAFYRDGRAGKFHRLPSTHTIAQSQHRYIVAALQRVVKVFNTQTIEAIANSISDPRAWSGYVTQLVTQQQRATWTAAAIEWSVLQAEEQQAWVDDATIARIQNAPIIDPMLNTINNGMALFCVAYALYSSGIVTAPDVPQADNADAWTIALTHVTELTPANALTLNGQVLTINNQTLTL